MNCLDQKPKKNWLEVLSHKVGKDQNHLSSLLGEKHLLFLFYYSIFTTHVVNKSEVMPFFKKKNKSEVKR